jgi:small conductance mechanosensitive channel
VSARDIGKAIAALEDEVTREPRVLAEPAPLVKVAAIAPPSVQLVVRAWTSGADFTATRLDLMRRIKERIDADALSA